MYFFNWVVVKKKKSIEKVFYGDMISINVMPYKRFSDSTQKNCHHNWTDTQLSAKSVVNISFLFVKSLIYQSSIKVTKKERKWNMPLSQNTHILSSTCLLDIAQAGQDVTKRNSLSEKAYSPITGIWWVTGSDRRSNEKLWLLSQTRF